MEIQAVQKVVNVGINNNIVTKVYTQVYDSKTRKTYYECVIYTHKGALETYRDKGQQVDTKT